MNVNVILQVAAAAVVLSLSLVLFGNCICNLLRSWKFYRRLRGGEWLFENRAFASNTAARGWVRFPLGTIDSQKKSEAEAEEKKLAEAEEKKLTEAKEKRLAEQEERARFSNGCEHRWFYGECRKCGRKATNSSEMGPIMGTY